MISDDAKWLVKLDGRKLAASPLSESHDTPPQYEMSARWLGIAVPLAPLLSGCAVLKLEVVNHAGPIAASQWHLYLIDLPPIVRTPRVSPSCFPRQQGGRNATCVARLCSKGFEYRNAV